MLYSGVFFLRLEPMSHTHLPDDLAIRGADGTIVLVVIDGLGGLPHPDTGLTELESASTPNLDALAAQSSMGMLLPVAPGVTPGSGPGHLSLFGYDPVEALIGRGVLSALGVGFDLKPGDVAARINLASVGSDGLLTDRRAGRPSDEEGRRIVARVKEGLTATEGVKLELIHEKEHRAVLILRGAGLHAELADTDPQRVGLAPLAVEALSAESEATARAAQQVLDQVRTILADEPVANAFLARGFGEYEPYQTFSTRYGLRAHASAKYPMYRGVARLVGMQCREVPTDSDTTVGVLERHFDEYDFHFLHFKDTDSRGHDGDFAGKVAAIEEVDALIPRIQALGPAVTAVTGDHSTPATYGEHTWHHVPTLIHSPWGRAKAATFGESSCRCGDLGVVHGTDLMTLLLAHARRMDKYGA